MKLKSLNSEQKETRRRILEVSHASRLSHLGSCLSAVDLINAIYKVKKKEEKFVLSNGHAGVALYVILEKNGLIGSKNLENLHVHPDRNPKFSIEVSTGSLGHGLPIALGMALADRNKNVYCIISDGETSEGSVWEALRIVSEQKLVNLKLMLNANGWGAYDPIVVKSLPKKFEAFGFKVAQVDGHNLDDLIKALRTKAKSKPLLIFAKTTVEQLPFLIGQDAHYYVMRDEDYEQAIKVLV